jgi:hypothetical protein
MKGYWQNLRPFEKRVLVGVATMLFAIFNLWFVLPHFSDLGKMRQRLKDAQSTLEKRKAAIAQIPTIQSQVNTLQREGLDVPAEEQALQFARRITDEQMRSGVTPQGGGKIFTQTNVYFLEQSTTVNVEGNEQQLIDFLFNLGSGDSMIRVRDMNLHPDAPRQRLAANVKLVASYQKTQKSGGSPAKPAPRVASSSNPNNPGPPSPVSSPAKKTNKQL